MKTARVQQWPEQWPQILRWVAAGEEVQVTQQDKVVAKVVPPTAAPQPDFLASAQKQKFRVVGRPGVRHGSSSDVAR